MEAGEEEAANFRRILGKDAGPGPRLYTQKTMPSNRHCTKLVLGVWTSLFCVAHFLFLSVRACALPFKGSFMDASQHPTLGQEALQEQGITPCLEKVNVPCSCLVLEEAHNNSCGMEDRLFRLFFCIVLSTGFHSVSIQRLTNPNVCTKTESLSRITDQLCFQCCHLKICRHLKCAQKQN